MNFIALDVETANSQQRSICQIGLAYFRDGELVETFSSLVHQHYFNAFNISIHGITPEAVQDAPRWAELWPQLAPRLHGATIVSHTLFDRGCITGACTELGGGLNGCDLSRWFDSCQISRRVWPELPNHKLHTVAHRLGISFQHHDALEDARACGLIYWAGVRSGKLTASPEQKPCRIALP